MFRNLKKLNAGVLAAVVGLVGCAPSGVAEDGTDNAFLDGENESDPGKADTGYVTNLNATEVEFDLEADVPANHWSRRTPLSIGQFALTQLRNHSGIYIQSLAEDYSEGSRQIEWQIDGQWVANDDPSVNSKRPTHFRLRAVNGIVMQSPRSLTEGQVFTARVPASPDTLYADVGKACGNDDGHISPDPSVYWYVWNPNLPTCQTTTQDAKLTLTRKLPAGTTAYPEYDRLIADQKIETIVFFGQIDDDPLTDSDTGWWSLHQFERKLTTAGFAKVEGSRWLRYQRVKSGITEIIDISSPADFAGLTDYANVSSFDEGVRQHEIIVWNGHSVLGASDFWSRPNIYSDDSASKYQIFFYNGCLGYEYYVAPILTGKGGWANVDIISNAVETPSGDDANVIASTLGMMMGGAERGGTTSWKRIIANLNRISGEEAGHYGVSGARDNAFHPTTR